MSDDTGASRYCDGQNSTVTELARRERQDNDDNLCLHLRLEPQEKRVVSWTSDTVDNENMGKKKSKCCCIYVKRRAWNESSSEEESETECDHCHGHVEKKAKKKNPKGDEPVNNGPNGNSDVSDDLHKATA